MTSWLRRWAPPFLIRVACVVGLVALAMMAFSLFVPRALPVILALSLAQALGAFALLTYLVAIVSVVAEHDRAAGPEGSDPERPVTRDE